MQIHRASGRITDCHTADEPCPWCKISKLRYDLEFQVMTIENGKPVESIQPIKNVCAHCFTVCNELPRMDFLCGKCGQLTIADETDGSEWPLFTKAFSGDDRFKEFYGRLMEGGVQNGKRYCLHCLSQLWQAYTANPDSVQSELEKSKPHFALKT